MTYEITYDNHVESVASRQHYRDVAQMLLDRFQIADEAVYAVGRGKGKFLRTCANWRQVWRGSGSTQVERPASTTISSFVA